METRNALLNVFERNQNFKWWVRKNTQAYMNKVQQEYIRSWALDTVIIFKY